MKKILTIAVLCCFAFTALAGCGGSKTESATVRIGAKSMTEQMILQEILAQLIEAKTDLTVERIEPIAGGTSNITALCHSIADATNLVYKPVLKLLPDKMDETEAANGILAIGLLMQ